MFQLEFNFNIIIELFSFDYSYILSECHLLAQKLPAFVIWLVLSCSEDFLLVYIDLVLKIIKTFAAC